MVSFTYQTRVGSGRGESSCTRAWKELVVEGVIDFLLAQVLCL